MAWDLKHLLLDPYLSFVRKYLIKNILWWTKATFHKSMLNFLYNYVHF